MKLLFWNMGGNDNVSLALSHMQANDVGVAAFAEHFGAKFSDGILRDSGYRVLGYGGCDKIVVLASESIEVLDCFEESRFTVLAMESSEARFVVAAAHLIDRMSAPDPALRLRTIRKMMGVVHGSESALSINNTIAMGDFNANPYDKELLLPEAFNAMLFKGLLRQNHPGSGMVSTTPISITRPFIGCQRMTGITVRFITLLATGQIPSGTVTTRCW